MPPVVSLVFPPPRVLSDPICLDVFCVVCHVSFPVLVLSWSVFSSVMNSSCFILYTCLSSHFRQFTSCPCVFPTGLITCSTPISFICPSLAIHQSSLPYQPLTIYTSPLPFVLCQFICVSSLCSHGLCSCFIHMFLIMPVLPATESLLKLPLSASALPPWSVSCISGHPAPTHNTVRGTRSKIKKINKNVSGF